MLERELEVKLKKIAKENACLFYKWISPGKSGVPDRILIRPGIVGEVIFVELKSPKGTGRLTPLQRLRHAELLSAGCRVVVVKSIDEFRALIK